MNLLQQFQQRCQRIADHNDIILTDMHKALLTKAFTEVLNSLECVQVSKEYVKKELELAQNFKSDLIDDLIREMIKKGAIVTRTKEDLANFKTITTAECITFCQTMEQP